MRRGGRRPRGFTAENPDVFYQAWAGLSNVFGIANPLDVAACDGKMLFHEGTRHKMSGLLVKATAFVAHGVEARPDDGFVTIASSKWGQFNGCIPADHVDELGMVTGHTWNPFTGSITTTAPHAVCSQCNGDCC